MAQNILIIACGGGLGAALRFLVSFYANEHGGLLFPYGTAIVNIAGSFMIGLCAARATSLMPVCTVCSMSELLSSVVL